MRVIIIERGHPKDLQIEINDILKDCDSGDIFDIKYSGNGCSSHTYSENRYSAMIILK